MQGILDYLNNLWESLGIFWEAFTDFLIDKVYIFIIDFLMWLSSVAFDLFLTLISGLAIGNQLSAYAGQLHPTIGYVFNALNIGSYITVIVTAYIVRIIINAITGVLK